MQNIIQLMLFVSLLFIEIVLFFSKLIPPDLCRGGLLLKATSVNCSLLTSNLS